MKSNEKWPCVTCKLNESIGLILKHCKDKCGRTPFDPWAREQNNSVSILGCPHCNEEKLPPGAFSTVEDGEYFKCDNCGKHYQVLVTTKTITKAVKL